jgi:hypothetical protein
VALNRHWATLSAVVIKVPNLDSGSNMPPWPRSLEDRAQVARDVSADHRNINQNLTATEISRKWNILVGIPCDHALKRLQNRDTLGLGKSESLGAEVLLYVSDHLILTPRHCP